MTSLDGTTYLVRLALRRDRWRLAVWVLVLLVLTYGSADAMGTTFPTQASLDAYARSVAGSPAVVAMSGPPIALGTLAGVVLNKVALTSLVGVVLVVVLTVVRHTRGDEEDGRSEMLRAAVVGRHAASAAAMLVAAGTALVIGVGTAVAVLAAHVPTSASWLFGMSLCALGVVFAAVALVLAQVFTHARSASGFSLAVFGLAYVVRAIGDVRGDGLVWLSPVGWVQATHPLGDERWWPLLLPVVAAALLVAVAVGLTDRRDLGSGVVAASAGSATASPLLSGPVGLAWRLQRGAVIGWTSGVLVLGLAFGSLSREVADMASSNPTLQDYLAAQGQGSAADSYLATMMLILALLAGAFAVSSALRVRAEETSGRLEVLLATGLSRTRWLLGSLVVTGAGTLLVLLGSGLGLGLSYGLVVSDSAAPLRLAGLVLVYAPAALATAALAVLLVGWWPRAAALAWAGLGFCFVVGWLGGLIRPPRWVEQLSPFEHAPAVPVDPVTLAAPAVTALVVVVVVAMAVAGLRRRDLGR